MVQASEKLQTPKFKSGRVNCIKIENGRITEDSKKENKFFSAAMPYIEHYEDRFNALNSVLFTHEFEQAVIPSGDNFGIELNKLISAADEWILIRSENAKLCDDFGDKIGKYVLNPGTMHYLDLSKSDDTAFVKNADKEQSGYVAMFSKNALSLREFGFDGIAHTKSINDILDAWQPNKIIELSSKIDDAGKRLQICKGIRYAIWGTGSAGSAAFDIITKSGGSVVFAVDKSCARHGCDFYGVTIEAPESLIEHDNEFDVLIAANYTRFPEIKRDALELGIREEKIQYINSLSE